MCVCECGDHVCVCCPFLSVYRTDCAHNCSGNGACNSDGTCVCVSGWAGPLCDKRACLNNCSAPQGSCDLAMAGCVCAEPFTGTFYGGHSHVTNNAYVIYWDSDTTVLRRHFHSLGQAQVI